MVDHSISHSKIESSMSRLVNDGNLTQITTTLDPVMTGHGKTGNPLKKLKTEMPQKGRPNEDKPNRRGKMNLNVPVKLYISGRNLKNMDMFSKSDPICVVFEKAQDREEWFEIGRTEFIKDTLDPNFETAIDVDYFFEKTQELKFEFIDDEDPGGSSMTRLISNDLL